MASRGNVGFGSADGRATIEVGHPEIRGGMDMPLIQVKILEGVFSPQQKQEIVKKLTDAMVALEGENMRPVTWCLVEEVKSGDWSIAGKPLTTGDVKALAAGGAKG
jgi:4-oxalocrotonate tautomerase